MNHRIIENNKVLSENENETNFFIMRYMTSVFRISIFSYIYIYIYFFFFFL